MRTIRPIILLLALLQMCQAQNPVTPKPRTSGTGATGTTKKLPPPVNQQFIPQLRLRGTELVEVMKTWQTPIGTNGSTIKKKLKVVFLFENWDDFPSESLQSMSEPSLPPDPCGPLKTTARLFAILHARSGAILGCTALKSHEDFYYLFEKDQKLPQFVFVDVIDRPKQIFYKSSQVSPWTGTVK